MEDANQGRDELIQAIEEEARREADRIVQEAQKAVEQRRGTGEERAESVLREAERKAQEQAETIKKRTDSRISAELRRLSLQKQEEFFRETLKEVSRKLEEMIEKPGYSDVLRGWIVEAVIGLNVKEATVIASKKEMPLLDSELLEQARGELEALTGRKIDLRVADSEPLLSQGVMAYAREGKLVFDNRVDTRLLRYRSEIRRVIYGELSKIDNQMGSG